MHKCIFKTYKKNFPKFHARLQYWKLYYESIDLRFQQQVQVKSVKTVLWLNAA